MGATESRDAYEILTERHCAGSIVVISDRGPDEGLATCADPVRAHSAKVASAVTFTTWSSKVSPIAVASNQHSPSTTPGVGAQIRLSSRDRDHWGMFLRNRWEKVLKSTLSLHHADPTLGTIGANSMSHPNIAWCASPHLAFFALDIFPPYALRYQQRQRDVRVARLQSLPRAIRAKLAVFISLRAGVICIVGSSLGYKSPAEFEQAQRTAT